MSRQEMLSVLGREHGTISPIAEFERSGRSLPAARWDGVRHHLVDDRPVLPKLRQKPVDGRRHVVSLPLCHVRHGPANADPLGDVARRSVGADYQGVGGQKRSRSRGATRHERSSAPRTRIKPEEKSAFGDAYKRRMSRVWMQDPAYLRRTGSIGPRLCLDGRRRAVLVERIRKVFRNHLRRLVLDVPALEHPQQLAIAQQRNRRR